MMRFLGFPVLLILLAHSLFAGDGVTHKRTLKQGNIDRSYFLYVPKSVNPEKPTRVLFAFHGGGGNAGRILRFYGIVPIADKYGLLVVAPQGVNKHWNDGRDSEVFKEQDATIDDVAFVDLLLAKVKAEFKVDDKRIYAMGMSNGGFMCQRLAIERASTFAAVAAVPAKMGIPLAKTTPTAPVSVMFINGTKDPLVPYNGGEVVVNLFPRLARLRKPRSRGKIISTQAAVDYWLKHNKIDSKPTVAKLPDKDPDDGSTVTVSTWAGANASVVLYKIDGGGHTYPGGMQYRSERFIGKTNRDFKAIDAIWSFLEKQKR